MILELNGYFFTCSGSLFQLPQLFIWIGFQHTVQNKAEIEKIIEKNDASLDNITMSNITNTNALMHEEEKRFLTIYGLFGVGQTIAVVFASLLLYLSTLTGAKTLHSKMLSNILRNPLSFFDTTPQVRVLEY